MLSFILLTMLSLSSKEITLSPATSHIHASVKIKPGVYTLAAKDGDSAVHIDADNITVDFQGAVLQSPDARGGKLDTFEGVGLAINGHKNVIIKHAVIHGYRFNLKAFQCSGLKLENCELGQSRSQKMLDGDNATSIWLGLRDIQAWRSYGSGAWLEQCAGAVLRGIKANQCQNGLILVNSDKNMVVGCDFSYESGWGIAMWKSSDNLICWNHADFVNRPWAGFWGGDSSGFTLTTGCNRNEFVYNSFTHGGDGFFLATLNGGIDGEGKLHEEGTCDDNVIAFNDGSWSTANAFESTFSSRNVFYRNWCDDSNYGFWLGYSNTNIVQGNEIKGSQADAIAHEQGADNWFVDNDIENTNQAAIHLWSGTDPRFQQSPSFGNHIIGNKIVKARAAFNLTNSTDYVADRNIVRNAPIPADFQSQEGAETLPAYKVPRLAEIMALKPAGFRLYRETDQPKGWKWLAPTAFGMRDYRNMLAPWMMKDAKTLRLYVPPNRVKKIALPDWMVMTAGDVPNERFITTKPNERPYGEYRNFKFQVIGKSGKRETIAGRVLDVEWRVRWFKWFRSAHDAYTDTAAWKTLFAGPALREENLPDLPAIPGYAPPEKGLPIDHFALVATSRIKLDGGNYQFDTLSDDGIQVLVDNKMVVDNWTHHGGTSDSGKIALSAGVHEIEVHYCQEDGAAALAVHWTKLSGS